MDDKNAAYYKTLYFIEDSDIDAVVEAGLAVQDLQKEFYPTFYNWMQKVSTFSDYYTDEVMEAIQENEEIFWMDLTQGTFDDEHIERQKFFALIFAETDMPFGAYIGFMNYYYKLLWEFIQNKELDTLALSLSFHKISGASISIITDGYNIATTRVLEEQNKALRELSTPITKLWEGILLLPLVGFIDTERSDRIMTEMLKQISETQAKIFILDISGISTMDTMVVNQLMKMTRATQLMGCVCLVTGISPNVAQTIVELDIDIDDIQTKGSLLDALKHALRLTGNKIN